MILIPYQVDVPMCRWPYANWAIIAVTVVVTVAAFVGAIPEDTIESMILHRTDPEGLFGHVLLHGSPEHLIGNMIFLFVFGNAVCAKIGNLRYIAAYLLLAFCAALTHMVFDGDPAIGASGAINGVVGMFLIYYPRNDVYCGYLVWFMFYIRWGSFEVASIVMILLWLGFDLLGLMLGGNGVAYMAHLGGLAAGVGLALGLLSIRWVEMEQDELSLVEWIRGEKHSRQRETLNAAIAREKAEDLRHAPEDDPLSHDPGLRRPMKSVEQEEAHQAPTAKINLDDLFTDDSPLKEDGDLATGATHTDRPAAESTAASPPPAPPPMPEIAPTPQADTDIPSLKPMENDKSVSTRCDCGKTLKAPGRMAGRTVCCPNCQRRVVLPE